MSSTTLDPAISAAIRDLDSASATDPLTIEAIRAASSRYLSYMAPPRAINEVRQLQIPVRSGELKARLYSDNVDVKALGDERPIVLFIHGGGWIAGSLEIVDSLCRSLAAMSGCIIVSIDYRLAPEWPYPAALEDCFDALAWVSSHREELGSRGPIVIAGESAGANLAAAVCIYARDRNVDAINHQLLIYPVTDDRCDTRSYATFGGGGYSLMREGMFYNWKSYVGDESADGLAAPLKNPDLRNLPSATVFVCELDILHDEGVAYAQRLKEDGVAVSLHDLPSLPHAALAFDGVSPLARAMVDEVAQSLRELNRALWH